MKHLFTVIVNTLLAGFSQGALAGHGFGNGGDPLALSFVGKGIEIQDYLESRNEVGPDELGFELRAFKSAVKNTRIQIVPQDLYDNHGVRVTARFVPAGANGIPSAVIMLNRTEWREQLRNGDDDVTYRFVLHEYLWAVGVDDTNYAISANIDLTGLNVRPAAVNAQPVPVASRRQSYTAVLKVPKRTDPILTCRAVYQQVVDALHRSRTLEPNIVQCIESRDHLRLDIGYYSRYWHDFNYHYAGPYTSFPDCGNDEDEQFDILKKHMGMDPLASLCMPAASDTLVSSWKQLLIAAKPQFN